MNKKNILTIIAVLILIGGITFYLSNDKPVEEEENQEEEVSVEEALLDAENVLDMEEELVALDNQMDDFDDNLLETYYEIENDYFVIRDKYYEGDLSEEELKTEIDKLLEKIEDLEGDIASMVVSE